MNREDIILGTKVYIAKLVESSSMNKPSIVVVTEYAVTQAGKCRFEIRGLRDRKKGDYEGMTLIIDSMQFSPAAAVDWLERRRKKDVEWAKKSLERAETMLQEDLKSIQEWRNSHGL